MGCSEWKDVLIKDVISYVVDNRGKTPPTSTNDEYELIEINAINESSKYPQYLAVKKYVSDDTYLNWFRKGHPQIGDILVPTVGTLGNVAYLVENRGCIAQNVIALRTNKKVCDSNFLYYVLRNPRVKQSVMGLDIGSVQPSIKVPHLLATNISIPSMNEQKAIAHILSTLDEKIETNNRINQVLEEMAQLLFKRWFVDFEFPNKDGEPYKSSGGEMVESELGLIPKGWEVRNLSEFLELKYGKALKATERIPGKYPVCGSNGIIGYHKDFLVKGPGIVVGRKGNVGAINYVWDNFFPIDTSFYVESKIGLQFLYFLLKEQNFGQISSDSVVPGLNKNMAYMNNAVKPISSILLEFEEICSNIFAAVKVRLDENKKLATLRDTLLPKLMSGEIHVPCEEELSDIASSQ